MRGDSSDDSSGGMGMSVSGTSPRSTIGHGGASMNGGLRSGRGYDVVDMGLLKAGGTSSDRGGGGGSVDAYDHELAMLHQQHPMISSTSGSIMSGMYANQIPAYENCDLNTNTNPILTLILTKTLNLTLTPILI